MEKEYVLIEKEVLENLIETINDLNERLESIEDTTAKGLDLIYALAEKMHVL